MLTICSLVARAGASEQQQVQIMADRMVEYARLCMKSKTRVSPFEREWLLTDVVFCAAFLNLLLLSHGTYIGEASREGMYFRGGVSGPFYLSPCPSDHQLFNDFTEIG